jgi:hypothetical protein
VTLPRLPSVTGSHKPPGWNRWSATEKVEHLLGMSFDRMHDYLSWPADGLDPYRLAAQAQVVRVVAAGRGQGRGRGRSPGFAAGSGAAGASGCGSTLARMPFSVWTRGENG